MVRTGELNGFLDDGCTIEGTVAFRDTLRVDGNIKGTVTSEKDLIVGPSGMVEGDVNVGVLQVSGTIFGSVNVSDKIIIHRGGRVFADITTPALVIEEGAVFQGKCNMEKTKTAEITSIAEQKQSK